MAIEKEVFFEIINEVSQSKDLNENNLLERIRNGLKEKDAGEYNKFGKNFSKEHQFSIKISEEAAEDWTLLHLAVACNNLLIVGLLLGKKVSVNARVKDGSKNDGPTALHIAASYGHENMVERLLKDDRVNPLLKSKSKTPREMVGDVKNKEAIVKMLEQNFRTQHEKKTSERCDSICSSGSSSDDSGLWLEQGGVKKLEVQLEELRTQLEERQKENQSLKQKIQDLESKNTTLNSELNKTKTNEVPLEKRQLSFLKVASVNLVTMLIVGAIFSIAFQLPVLLIIATSVTSALVTGGVTCAISTELKEVNIQNQQYSPCKT